MFNCSALNRVYLAQRDDVSSSLLVALARATSPSLDNLTDATTIESDVAVRLATLRYQDCRKLARRWDGAAGMATTLLVKC